MNIRKILAASVLGLGTIVLTTQVPPDAAGQDAKANKKAGKGKFKLKSDPAEQPKSDPDAKPVVQVATADKKIVDPPAAPDAVGSKPVDPPI